jgi:hypothetical protein
MKKLLLAATLAIAAIIPAQATEISDEDAKKNALSLAAKNVVFVQFCEREYLSITPLERDAIEFFVTDVAAKYGNAAVKEAAVESYKDGYYPLGDRWCSIMRNTVRSIANAMSRR